MSSWARVGVRCTCIATGRFGYGDETQPDVGSVYTVRKVILGGKGLLLEEIYNPCRAYKEGFGEIGFDVDFFRPLITKSQEDDISMFKSLLKPTEVPA